MRAFAERQTQLRAQDRSGILKPSALSQAKPYALERAASRPFISDRARPVLSGHDFSRVPVHRSVTIQRQCSDCEEDERGAIQTKPAQASASPAAPESGLDTGAAVRAAEGAGATLPAEVRSYFEPRFGYDLSAVRVHADGEAAEAARAVRARAYTIGHDIVFGSGEYAPSTQKGQRLLAHELAHVVQQTQASAHRAFSGSGLSDAASAPRQEKPILSAPHDPAETEADRIAETVAVQGRAAANLPVRESPPARRGALMRQPTEPTQSALEQLPDDTRKGLKVDVDTNESKFKDFFDLEGTPRLASNVDADIDVEAPAIESLKDNKVKTKLYRGLKLYAQGRFDLLPGADGKAKTKRLNLVLIENLDLTPWGGPNTSFRFTCTGSEAKGKIKVKILIEGLSLPAKPMADPVAAAGIEKTKATPYGLTRDSSISDAVWQKILRSLGKIQETLIMRVRDITFEASPKDKSPKGEDAQFLSNFADGTWTRRILIFQNMINSKDEDFALTLAHEMGHAINEAPSQGAAGVIAGGEVFNDPKFKEAMKKDGGRANAITKYGATDDNEFFAECFALYIQQPDTLRTLRPNIYAFFKEYEFGALKDPKLNPYYRPPGKPAGMGLNLIGPF